MPCTGALQSGVAMHIFIIIKVEERHGAGGGVSVTLHFREGFADLDISYNLHYSHVSPRTLAFPEFPDRNGFDWYLVASKESVLLLIVS